MSGMLKAVKIVVASGYEIEELPKLRGEQWRALVSAAPSDDIRHCIQSLRWTGGDVKKLHAARHQQKLRRRKHYLVA